MFILCNVFTHEFKAYEDQAMFPHPRVSQWLWDDPSNRGRGMPSGWEGASGVHLPRKWTLTLTPEAGGDVPNPGRYRLAQVCPGPRRGGARGVD